MRVIRRVGGLEVHAHGHAGRGVVIRRVGGLEVFQESVGVIKNVIRRVGGLEDNRQRENNPV